MSSNLCIFYYLLFIISILLFSPLVSIANSASVSLQWDPVDEDIAGYKIYYGTDTQNFSYVIDVGNITEYTVNGLTKGLKYYFAVTSYNEYGLESDYSNIISIPVHVIAPDGGEVLPTKSTFKIKWEAIPQAVKFKLLYSIDEGLTWYPITENYVKGTSYNWTVPRQVGNKKKCLVKVVGYDSYDVKVGADASDEPFTIEVVKLTSPNGEEIFTSGNRYTITWETHATKENVARVELYYRTDDTEPWILIKTRSGNPESVGWIIPDVQDIKNKCKVKVLLRNSFGNSLGSDVSDSYFTIQPSE